MRTDPDEAKSGYLSIVPRGPGSEVPTMFGSLSARISSNGAEIPKKMCSLLLALLLALSLMPNAAWAAGAENVPGTSSAEASALTNSSLGAGDAVAEGSLPGDTVVAGADTSEGSNSRNESAAEGTPPESVLPVDVAASPGHVSGEGDVSSPSAGSDMFTEETPLSGAELAEPSPVVLYAASLAKNGEGTYVFSVGDTIEARAKEKGAPTGVYIEPEKLTYQWQVSTDNVTFTEVSEQTTSELVLDAGYQGRYVKCVISAKVGDSKAATRVTKVIGAAGSINVTSVAMNKSGNLYPGDVVMASATSGSDDVTSNEKVTWSWYYGNTAAAATTRIEGATTSSLTVTEDMMGAYLVARADGGFGEVKSSAAGPVVQKGAFKLYKVEASGSAEVGKTLSALAYSDDDRNTPVSDQAVVAYQWQYADTSTTSDAAFKDIPGATSKSYTIAADMLGKYVRVKAKSLNTSVSTSKPYGGSTQPVSPLGPVKLEGAYELSSVKLSSTGQAMQAGSVLTPVAQYKKGYYEYDVPADAKVSYTWLVADAQLGDFAPLTSGVDASGKLTLDAALAGKWVKVSAHALINNATSTAYRVLAEDTYDLLRATLTPSSGDLFTGSEITAKVQAKNLTSVSTGDDVSDKVTLVWSVGDTAQGSFVPLGGADSKTLTIPAAAAGKFLKVTATSGDSSVEVVTSKAVVDSDTLEGAAKKLEAKSFKATPAYGQDTNINEVVRAKLAELGYDDIAVTTKSAVARQTNENATVGVSVAPGETNGDITYFFMDPDTASSSYFSYTQLRQFNFTFVLARNGQSYEYKPSYVGTIPWDEAQVSALLNKKAETLNIGFASSDEANAVTKNLTLPYKLKNDSGATKSWSSVSWISSDTAVVKVSGSGWSDSTGAVTRTAADRAVTLTATVSAGGISSSGGPSTTVEKSFDVTVKGDPDKVAAEKAALEQKVQTNFTYDNLKLSETGAAIDKDAVSGDITLPNPRTIGVDGKYYAVTYSASNDTVVIDTYRGSVYRPLSGAEKAPVDLTVTVTDKSNPEITATKTLGIQIAPLEQSDITRELELMDAAKAGYFNAVANGQTTDAVTQNLLAFQKAYFDASGSLTWAYDYASTNAAGNGIVPVDLEGYDPMGSGGWRLFKSSRPGVVSHENLLVKQPEYNTQVTLSSRLSSEKYARYAQRYPENASFQKLANQNVSATFTVVGTSGVADPNAGREYAVTAKVIGASGLSENGTYRLEEWVPLTEVILTNGDDKTAWDVFARVLDDAGCTYSKKSEDGLQTGDPYSITKNGFTLGMSSDWKQYWAFFVNGKYANSYASKTYLEEGDAVELRFINENGTIAPPDGAIANPDAEHPDLGIDWGGYGNGGKGSIAENEQVPTEKAEAAWTLSLLTEEERANGATLSTSDVLIIGGKLYMVTGSTVYDPVTWAPTSSRAHLVVIDPSSGNVERNELLAASVDSTCRPVYANGILVVPLAGGYMQALSAATLETLWVASGIAGSQAVSTLTVEGDYVYVSTVDSFAGDSIAATGTIRRFNLYTGALAGQVDNDDAGYYWAGGVIVGGFFIVPDDSGNISSYSADLKKKFDRVKISDAPLRTTLVTADGFVYAVSRDGVFYKVSVSADGSLRQVGEIAFASYSTSTPTIVNGYAYVGGSQIDFRGVLARISLATLEVSHVVTMADNAGLVAEVKSSPLVVTSGGHTYVYFTCNGAQGSWPNWTSGGGVYVYRVGDVQATSLYDPEGKLANYCMASVAVGPDGTLYYTNDSGNLFALRAILGGNPGDDGASGGNGNADSGNFGDSVTGDQGSGASGYVSPANTPLQKMPAQAADVEKKVVSDGVADAVAKGAISNKGAEEAFAATSGEKDAAGQALIGVSPWAVGGIALGVVGLVCATVYLVRTRRKPGASGMTTEGK